MPGALLLHLLLYAVLPLALLWRVRVRAAALAARRRRSAWARWCWRPVLVVGALLAVFQPLASLMRNHKEVRYLITPANFLWSLGGACWRATRAAPHGRASRSAWTPRPGPCWRSAQQRRWCVVLVVGETARAANWGLNGYARQTTPRAGAAAGDQLPRRRRPAAPTPRSRCPACSRRSAGATTTRPASAAASRCCTWSRAPAWRCTGATTSRAARACATACRRTRSCALNPAGLCADGRCLDEGLLAGLDERLARAQGTQLWCCTCWATTGPSYFRRYPPAFARFQPACQSDDLRQCSREQIVNAYDNALLYTDHVLASLIAKLQAQADRVDTALLYVSDHGESLGENGLFLHGLPYAIAPEGADPGADADVVLAPARRAPIGAGRRPACARARGQAGGARPPVPHRARPARRATALYEPAWDLAAGCRPQSRCERACAPAPRGAICACRRWSRWRPIVLLGRWPAPTWR